MTIPSTATSTIPRTARQDARPASLCPQRCRRMPSSGHPAHTSAPLHPTQRLRVVCGAVDLQGVPSWESSTPSYLPVTQAPTQRTAAVLRRPASPSCAGPILALFVSSVLRPLSQPPTSTGTSRQREVAKTCPHCGELVHVHICRPALATMLAEEKAEHDEDVARLESENADLQQQLNERTR